MQIQKQADQAGSREGKDGARVADRKDGVARPLILAAIRDPKTGKIYTRESHAAILDEMEDKNFAVFARLRKIYMDEGNFPFAEHVGFLGDDAVLLNRSAAQKKWGVYYSQDIKRIK